MTTASANNNITPDNNYQGDINITNTTVVQVDIADTDVPTLLPEAETAIPPPQQTDMLSTILGHLSETSTRLKNCLDAHLDALTEN